MCDPNGIEFEDWLDEELSTDEAFRQEYERLGPGFDIAALRIKRGLTQKELAERVGSKQPSISRLETGDQEPSLSFLRRVAAALDARLEIHIIPHEEQPDPTLATDKTQKQSPSAKEMGMVAAQPTRS